MGRFTPEQLSRMAPGHSPQELADLDMDDGEWQRKGAELHAAHAQSSHELEMLKANGVHEINNLRFDESVIALANHIRVAAPHDDKPGLDDIIENIVAPYRDQYLASFESQAPVTRHRVGLNEAAFNKLLGGGDE